MKVLKFSPSRTLILLLVVLFSAFNLSYAQLNNAKSKAEKQKFNWKFVTGKVVNEDGYPLEGAVVSVFQTAYGAVTDAAGNFKIISPENSTLSFYYIGFRNANIKPSFDKDMIIALKTERIGIDPIEIYPPDYYENAKTLSSIINERTDIDQAEKTEVQAIRTKQNETADLQLVEKKATINLNNALIVKNDTICPNLKLEDVDPAAIWSIRFLDKENAIKKYGAIAKNGVIEISSIGIGSYGFFVEEMPEFPGGVSNLRKVLKTNIRYPELALKKGTKGTVFTSFVVDKRGLVTNVKIEKSIDPLFDNEVLQAVKNLPRWKAGRQRGKPVSITYVLPVIFKIPYYYHHGSAEKLHVK